MADFDYFEELPYSFLYWLYQFIVSATWDCTWGVPFLYILSNACYLLSLWWWLSWQGFGGISLWLWFAFPWWWVMVSIFFCVCWQSVCLWKNVHLGPLPIIQLGCLFSFCWVLWVFCIFCMLTLIRYIVCKYPPPFSRLLFCFADGFCLASESFWFDVVSFVCFCFCCPCLRKQACWWVAWSPCTNSLKAGLQNSAPVTCWKKALPKVVATSIMSPVEVPVASWFSGMLSRISRWVWPRFPSNWGYPVAQWGKNLPAMQGAQETWVWSLGQEDALEKEMVTHSSILAWKIPWTEEPDWL